MRGMKHILRLALLGLALVAAVPWVRAQVVIGPGGGGTPVAGALTSGTGGAVSDITCALGTCVVTTINGVSPGTMYPLNLPTTGSYLYSDGSAPQTGTLGACLTGTGPTINLTQLLHDISGSGVAIVTGDACKLDELGAFTYTLAQAGTTGFGTGWGLRLVNLGASDATVNATTSVFKGASGTTALVIHPNCFADINSDNTNYQTQVGCFNAALLNVADQTVTGGANVTSDNLGTVSSGTTTIDCGARPTQYLTNNGAFTLAAPANDGTCVIKLINGASAGTITFSGFSVGTSTGDALDTTSGHKFMVSIARIAGDTTYRVGALQ